MNATRAGVALLLAVATLVLVLSGVTAAAMAMHGARQSAWTSTVDGRLLAGLQQGERLAVAWLNASADAVVLPPAGGGLALIDDRFVLASGEGRLRVTAYDGLSGIPACLAQRGSALRTALPRALAELAVPPISPQRAEESAHLVELLALPEGVPRFPSAPAGPPRTWRAVAAAVPAVDAPAGEESASLAGTISFHSDGRINLNTAPEALLRAAWRELRLDGIDELLQRRRQGIASRPPQRESVGEPMPRLVDRSDRWQMLITVEWQGIRRGWWVVFAGKSGAFSMVARHDVRE